MPIDGEKVLVVATDCPVPFPALRKPKSRLYLRQVGTEPTEVSWENYWERRLLKKEIALVAPKADKPKKEKTQ